MPKMKLDVEICFRGTVTVETDGIATEDEVIKELNSGAGIWATIGSIGSDCDSTNWEIDTRHSAVVYLRDGRIVYKA